MDTLSEIKAKLRVDLCRHAKSIARTRRLTYKTLPLINDLKYQGIALRPIMSPKVPNMSGIQARDVFDSWLSPLTDSAVTRRERNEDVVLRAGRPIVKYASKGDTEGESIVLLLYALSAAPDCRLTYDSQSMLLESTDCTFGLRKGAVVSRFASGHPIDVDPKQVLEGHRKVRTFDVYFHSLYREAYRRGKGALEALLAIHMGQPDFNFREFAAEATNSTVKVSDARADKWAKIISEEPDPIEHLYRPMVPKYMTRAAFGVLFGAMSNRRTYPTLDTRHAYIAKMYKKFDIVMPDKWGAVKQGSGRRRSKSTAKQESAQ